MSKNLFLVHAFLLSAIFLSAAVRAEIELTAETSKDNLLTVGCSDWKPYCFFTKGQLQGPSYDVAQKVLRHSQIDYEFNHYPWTRIYNLALTEPNYLILGLGRTEKRENLFNWIGPLKKPSLIYVYQLKDAPKKIIQTTDLTQLTMAVERAAFTQDYLLKRGYDKDKLIRVSRMEQLLKMALHHRIDGFMLDEKVFQYESQRNNIDPNLFRKAFLAFEVNEYLAASKNTPINRVDKIKQTYKRLLQQGDIQLPD